MMRGEYLASAPPVIYTARAYALHYWVLSRPRPQSRPEPRPERPPASRPDAVMLTKAHVTPVSTLPPPSSRTGPVPSALQIRELPPGAVAGVGQVISVPGSDAPSGPGLLGKLGFQVPGRGEIGPPKSGLDRVAELLAGAGSACPELRPPVALAHRGLAVTVAFEVDTHGAVDRNTLGVIESPGRPQTEHRFQSHIYVVGAKVRPDRGHIDPAAYDSVVSHEVASHVADLVFRPALKEGRTVRSTVLISCQTSRAD
jgi:hypothetical protein